jgi:hypothetical protein
MYWWLGVGRWWCDSDGVDIHDSHSFGCLLLLLYSGLPSFDMMFAAAGNIVGAEDIALGDIFVEVETTY